MTIVSLTFVPYDYPDKYDALNHIISRCHGIKKSLRFVEMQKEHLIVRCPFAGDYLEVLGTAAEIAWLHKELTLKQWYRPN